MVESLCNGAFISKTANNAWIFFEEIAKNTLEWEPVRINAKQPTTTTTTTNKGVMHKVNSKFENDVRMTALVRRLEALEMSKGAQSSVLEPFKLLMTPFVSSVTVMTTW